MVFILNDKLFVMKDAFLKRDWLVIDDEKIADTLTDPDKYAYLVPFMRGERTLTEAAHDLGMKPNALFYQVKRLEKMGLIYVVRTQKRKGRASKIYRASAKRFIIPYHSTSAESMEAIMYRIRKPADKKLVERYLSIMQSHTETFGLWLSLAEDNLLEMVYAPLVSDQWLTNEQLQALDFPAVFSKLASFPLDLETAKELQHGLIDLFEKARVNAKPNGKRYLMNFSLVPLED